MNIQRNPGTMAAPIGPFCHASEVPEGIEAQAEATWTNIEACLAEAGMSVADLVKITTFVVRPEDLPAAGKARAAHLGAARPTSTTIIVSALVIPTLLTEIEAVAAAGT